MKLSMGTNQGLHLECGNSKSFNQWEAPTLCHAVFIGIKVSCYKALQVDCSGTTSNKRQLIQLQ